MLETIVKSIEKKLLSWLINFVLELLIHYQLIVLYILFDGNH